MHIPGNIGVFMGLLVLISLLLFVVVPLGVSYWHLFHSTSHEDQSSIRDWKEPCSVLIGLIVGNGAALWFDRYLNSNHFFSARPALVLILLLLIDLPFLLFIFDYFVARYASRRSTRLEMFPESSSQIQTVESKVDF